MGDFLNFHRYMVVFECHSTSVYAFPSKEEKRISEMREIIIK